MHSKITISLGFIVDIVPSASVRFSMYFTDQFSWIIGKYQIMEQNKQIKSRIKYVSNICVDHGEGENNREDPDQEQSLPAVTGRYSSNVNREEKMFLVSSPWSESTHCKRALFYIFIFLWKGENMSPCLQLVRVQRARERMGWTITMYLDTREQSESVFKLQTEPGFILTV